MMANKEPIASFFTPRTATPVADVDEVRIFTVFYVRSINIPARRCIGRWRGGRVGDRSAGQIRARRWEGMSILATGCYAVIRTLV